jgi:hypothetical protein
MLLMQNIKKKTKIRNDFSEKEEEKLKKDEEKMVWYAS